LFLQRLLFPVNTQKGQKNRHLFPKELRTPIPFVEDCDYMPDDEDDKKKLPDEFFEEIYEELRRLARLVRWRGGLSDTLQTGVLVSELYLKIRNHPEIALMPEDDRRGIFINALKQIVINASRKKSAGKRMEGGRYVPLEDLPGETFHDGLEAYLTYKPIIAELRKRNPRQAQVFEYHFEDGMTFDEIAAVLNVSKPTVGRDWKTARAFWGVEIKRARGI
jgi:RNA polymerase sigma factor (TIGR02999 family)